MDAKTYDTLIDEIEHGATLKAAITTAKTSWRALQLHIERDDVAASRYAHARTLSAQWWADKAVDAVDAATDGESATIGRVRSDVYRWRAKVANPREYGDKVDVQAEVRHTVSGVIALPDEDSVPLPRTTILASLATPSPTSRTTSRDDVQVVEAQDVDAVGEGVGGGDGT